MGVCGIPETDVTFSNKEVAGDIIVILKFSLKKGFAGLINACNAQRLSARTVALGIAQRAFERHGILP